MTKKLFKPREPAATLDEVMARQYKDGVAVGKNWAIFLGGMFSVALGLYASQPLLSGIGAAAVLLALLVIRQQGRSAYVDREEYLEDNRSLGRFWSVADDDGQALIDEVDEDDVPWIPGTPYRADCAVGQLRPTGMRPCSPEPPIERTRHRFNDLEPLCIQHTYPTLAECETRAEDLMEQAAAARGRALSAEREWDREQNLAASSWLEQRASRYRLSRGLGMTADRVQAIELDPPAEGLVPELPDASAPVALAAN